MLIDRKYKMFFIFLATTVVLLFFNFKANAALDTEALGQIYGDSAGIARMQILENQLHNMTIKSDHPRIHLTPDLIASARAKVAAGNPQWTAILNKANGSVIDDEKLVDMSFAYEMFAVSDPTQAATYANNVYNQIMNDLDTNVWPAQYESTTGTNDKKIANWALAFDWVYNGLTFSQQQDLINKISAQSNMVAHSNWIRSGGKMLGGGESFHRETWIFYNYNAWPEIALAGHLPDVTNNDDYATYSYRSRWNYDWIYGDAIRSWAYLNDGTNVEGYQVGADGIGWFEDLKSATGIDLINGSDFQYAKNAADYLLYNTDFSSLDRMINHYGVRLAGGGNASLADIPAGSGNNWKNRVEYSQTFGALANVSPFYQYVINHQAQGVSYSRTPADWIFTNNYYSDPGIFQTITKLLYYDPNYSEADIKQATYDQLSFARLFPGAKEISMRSSWGDNASIATFRSRPAFTKTSHGDYDINSFLLYRKGNLSPDTGFYDTPGGTISDPNQTNYFGYKVNTLAHNDVLITDPTNPSWPSHPNFNPGGINTISTKMFSAPTSSYSNVGNAYTFLHRPTADSAKVLAFETNPSFDYSTIEASKAYGNGTLDPADAWSYWDTNRLAEYSRTFLFLRKPNDKAYAVIFDKINANSASYQKKWLVHAVTEPTFTDGSTVNTEVDGHIYTNNSTSWQAQNVQGTSEMYGKVLLPQNPLIRKVGGTGYEFWVDDGTTNTGISGLFGKNYPVDWPYWECTTTPCNANGDYRNITGGPLEEIGTWRLEVMPPTQNQRDLFLNVIYMGDAGESPADSSLINTSESTRQGAFINDSNKNEVIIFNKNKFGSTSLDTFSYDVNSSTSSTEHIITELEPNSSFTIKQNGTVITAAESSSNGILTFISNGSGESTFNIIKNIPTTVTYKINDFVGWLQSDNDSSDVNRDGKTNTKDLGIMMSKWN